MHPALGQEAVLILSLQVLGRLQPAAPGIVLQALAMEHGLVCGGLPSHLSCICLVLGNLPPIKLAVRQSVNQGAGQSSSELAGNHHLQMILS